MLLKFALANITVMETLIFCKGGGGRNSLLIKLLSNIVTMIVTNYRTWSVEMLRYINVLVSLFLLQVLTSRGHKTTDNSHGEEAKARENLASSL